MEKINENLSAAYLLVNLAITYLGDAVDAADEVGKAFRFDLKKDAVTAEKALNRIRGTLSAGIGLTKQPEFLADFEALEHIISAYLNVNRDKSIEEVLNTELQKLRKAARIEAVEPIKKGPLCESVKYLSEKGPLYMYLDQRTLMCELARLAEAEGFADELIGTTMLRRLCGKTDPMVRFEFDMPATSNRFPDWRRLRVEGYIVDKQGANYRRIFIKPIKL